MSQSPNCVSANWVIEHFKMSALPVEETLYAKTYESTGHLPDGGPIGTAIIALFSHSPLSRSLFHSLTEPEIWHFYAGDPVHLHLIDGVGTLNTVTLGSDLAAGQIVQHVIPAGVWQAAEIAPGGDWGLIGCTMAPGFTPSGFIGITQSELLSRCPDQKDLISRLGVTGETSRMPHDFKD